LGISQSHQYERSEGGARRHYRKPEDERYLALIRQISDERPTYGYRRITAILNRILKRKGEAGVNYKRVFRIMKIHHLLLAKHTGGPGRILEGTIITLKSNKRWCSYVFEILCWNGERIRVAFCMDCADREILSYIATTGGIIGEMVRDLMVEAIEYRF
jgi:transposase InsO family protein